MFHFTVNQYPYIHTRQFDIQRAVHRVIFLQQNQRDSLISQIYFWSGTLRVSDRFSVHHQESSTVYTTTGICHTGFADCLLAGSGCSILIPLASGLVGFIIRIYHDARSSECQIPIRQLTDSICKVH